MAESRTFSIEELAAMAERHVRGLGLMAHESDGRISPAPDARTVRYYTSLGLVDRPTIEDRQARYGLRHVLQLVAVKALQAAGQPLASIQQRLYGRSEHELEAIIDAVTQTPGVRPTTPPPAVRSVREVMIEPGLRLVAEAGWQPRAGEIETRIKEAIAALLDAR